MMNTANALYYGWDGGAVRENNGDDA
jgi:hypothetical protein